MWVDPDLINEPLDPLPWEKPRFSTIPGTDPLAPDDWLRVSDTFEGQMQERARLIRERPGDVIAKTATSTAAVEELFDATLDILRTRAGYDVSSDSVTRPDGVEVRISDPLCTLGHLVQEDLCIMEAAGEEYALTAAVLCFPASWTLAEKIGHPMTRIHAPVDTYDDVAAKRVGRLFHGLQVGRPITRWNGVFREKPNLFDAEPEAHHAHPRPEGMPVYFRSERQCLVRLPKTRAIVFSIHTYIWRLAELRVPPPPRMH